MEHKVKHEMTWHRETPSRLAALRRYYVNTGMKGKLSSIHILIEFIEAYAELKGWDLDSFDREDFYEG